MVEALLKRYEAELRNKIAQKMIPNKTEEQILLQNFKYYDMDGSSMCNLRNFIKTHERLGVVLSKIKDIEEIFNYFDVKHSGLINYKKFSKEIFELSSKDKLQTQPKSDSQNFITILDKALIKNGGNIALISLLKELQIVDYNNSNRISIDDFIKIANDLKLSLTPYDYQILFQSYEYFQNGIFFYGDCLRLLLAPFWNKNREKMAQEFSRKFSPNNLSLKEIAHVFVHVGYIDAFVNAFKFVEKIYSSDSNLRENEVRDFVMYFGYGMDEPTLAKILFEAAEEETNHATPIVHSSTPKKSNTTIQELISNLNKLSRKTLFNFIKHFRYYDNNTKTISKYDFVKVLKDYRINMPLLKIEELFEEFSSDPKKTFMNYEHFLKIMTEEDYDDERKDIVQNAYHTIEGLAQSKRRDFNIDFIKELYYAKDNILNKDETACQAEFDDCIELFHFCYKGINGLKISLEEFLEFYSFISLLVPGDNYFIDMVSKEWKLQGVNSNVPRRFEPPQPVTIQQKSTPKPQMSSPVASPAQQPLSISQQAPQQPPSQDIKSAYKKSASPKPASNQHQEDPLVVLTSKLKMRGVRGLLYLHRQFLIVCQDVTKITLKDFIHILLIQHIILSDKDYEDIFNAFSSNGYLNFNEFIRNFKRELNEAKLVAVERAFSNLDIDQNEKVPIDNIKMFYNSQNHPDVLSGKKTEDELALEFIDCFDINYLDLMKEESGFVNFEIFANFYEYVAFIYENDNEFENVVSATWSC